MEHFVAEDGLTVLLLVLCGAQAVVTLEMQGYIFHIWPPFSIEWETYVIEGNNMETFPLNLYYLLLTTFLSFLYEHFLYFCMEVRFRGKLIKGAQNCIKKKGLKIVSFRL